ncbi:hypothetical protein PVK64_12600 [Aliivibrio sp. S4TY2]|uniref:hypothetical protein n=1 Tax=unclassified Aliivibrio TaxID=2645654 RepID=UPI00237997EE|nr:MULTISPECIES: hypothetical protein [unclassified Aliivibrio]MDD9157017.1 hypothetical protein [Aliivibrio sp. S4TY2]MDD9160769.1 hypothetical protein [Aliivibrio sp. S4TY1]MDD9164798.1 hypothetical protein [Aliivibrio sp. S4MY2]MDD9168927.1 hypothetical protein [Aliivibrio sp. S4MY4]MDD9185455.1 hypothetical protein [Aliivibrio sp. S4MY3]
MGSELSVEMKIMFSTLAVLIPVLFFCYKALSKGKNLSSEECIHYSIFLFASSLICALLNEGYIDIINTVTQDFSNYKYMEIIISNQHLLVEAITKGSGDVSLEPFKKFITEEEQKRIDLLIMPLNIIRMFVSFFGFSLSAILLGFGLTKSPPEINMIVQNEVDERLTLLEKKTDHLLKVLYCILGMMILFAVFYLFDRYF